MDLLAAYDPYLIFSLSMGFVLALCITILFFMRDPYAVPPYHVSRFVWCAGRRRGARVDFVESVVTGMVQRSVEQCSLRGPNGQCGNACCHASA